MLHRLVRPDVCAADLTPTTPVAVLGPGSSLPTWDSGHPATAFLFQYVPVVYSIVLPFHGTSSVPYRGTIEEIVATIDQLHDELLPLVSRRYVVMLGYSMGGLYLMKLYPRLLSFVHPASLVLAVGSALKLNDTGPIIDEWWDRLFASRSQVASLARYHTDLASIRRIIHMGGSNPASPLFSSREDRRVLSQGQVYFVCGNRDLAYPAAELTAIMDENDEKQRGGDSGSSNSGGWFREQRVWMVDSDHVSFFKRKEWEKTQAALTEIAASHIPPSLVKPPTHQTHQRSAL